MAKARKKAPPKVTVREKVRGAIVQREVERKLDPHEEKVRELWMAVDGMKYALGNLLTSSKAERKKHVQDLQKVHKRVGEKLGLL